MDYAKLIKIADSEGTQNVNVPKMFNQELPELTEVVKQNFGMSSVTFQEVNVRVSNNRTYLYIQSDDLLGKDANSAVDKLLFSKIYLYACVQLTNEQINRGLICFSFDLQYNHVDGGSNGKEIGDLFALDLRTGEITYGRQAIRQKYYNK